MKTKTKSLGRVWVLGLFSFFVWAAWAQDMSDNGSGCGVDAVQATQRACPASGDCPVADACPAMANGESAGRLRCPRMNALSHQALSLEYRGKRMYLRCPRREGVFGNAPQKSASIRPQFSI
jgi:hypothetical protein